MKIHEVIRLRNIYGGKRTLDDLVKLIQGNKIYECPKCGNDSFETDQFQATGGTVAKVLDIQNKKFTAVSCKKCGYTELYKEGTGLSNVLDFFI